MQNRQITVIRATPDNLSAELLRQVEAIFFEASGRVFAPGAEREAFRERWLGRYLRGGSDALLLALAGGDTVAGYLVGAVENPGLQDRFADFSYFRADFAELCRHYPAHLHINLAPAFRGKGVGGLLIEAFAAYAAGQGAAGLHAVTGRAMRNVRFYQRCGFREEGTTSWNGREIVFLARKLGPPS